LLTPNDQLVEPHDDAQRYNKVRSSLISRAGVLTANADATLLGYSASGCGCVVHYDVKSSRAYTLITSATELQCALAVSGDGRHLAIAGATGVVIIYSIVDHCRARLIEAHSDTIKVDEPRDTLLSCLRF
jgi:hypothetical protein